MNEAHILYSITIIMGVYWMYRLLKIYLNKEVIKSEKKIDDNYSDILNSEKYRVKGKFET